MLEMITAGESHGKGLIAVLSGLPAGLKIDRDIINAELKRRQHGYGRGGRMKIEFDSVEIISGLRNSITLGSPVAMFIKNRDFRINPLGDDKQKELLIPRPGHSDYAGAIKFNHKDIRNVLERASARETAARVACGSLCKQFLKLWNIEIGSYVIQIGQVKALIKADYKTRFADANKSNVSCPDKKAAAKMRKIIDEAKRDGESLGGIFEVVTLNVPIGLGSFQTYKDRLDARLAGAVMSIPAIKGVEIGLGFEAAVRVGSQVHDSFVMKNNKIKRKTNNAGGLEAGITNGEPLILRAAMKPIATLSAPLDSVNLKTGKKSPAIIERSDVCAVAAAGVVAESMVAFELVKAFLERFGGDSVEGIKLRFSKQT